MATTKLQQKYWEQMIDYKFGLYYNDLEFRKYIKINRWIEGILAVLSCGAVATWGLWKKYQFLWATIVMLTQVAKVVIEFLPYKSRIKPLSELNCKLMTIYENMELEWFKVSSGDMDNDIINSKIYDYRKQWQKAENDYFKEDTIPDDNKKSLDKATMLAFKYFEQFGDDENETDTQQSTSQSTTTV